MQGNRTVSWSKWWLLSFAFAATVINYLDRQTLSVMAPLLLQKFHISALSYGRIIALFMFAYTIMNGISGRLLDRLGTRVGYALTVAVWSAAELLHAFTAGAVSLGIFRFLLGIGEAGNYPAGVRLIAERFPPAERSHASGIFNSGAAVGAILAPPLLAWIVLSSSWRVAFIAVGATGFVWTMAWLAVYPQEQSPIAVSSSRSLPLKSLLHSRFLWQFTLSKFFSDPVWYFYTFWFPQYLRIVHAFTLKQIGETAWIPFIAAAVGNIAGGVVFSRLLRLNLDYGYARRIAIVVFSVLMSSAAAAGFMKSPAACIAVISVATFGYSGSLANLLAVPGDVFPANTVASIWGLASMGAGFGGMLFSLVTGWLVERYSFSSAFLLFSILPLIAAGIVWTLPQHRDTHDPDPIPGPAHA
jgi:ACS family hexuronate transporter-like MFS transporter